MLPETFPEIHWPHTHTHVYKHSIARIGKQPRSFDRWTDKEAVVYIYNRMLLNRNKEHIWVNSNEVDEPKRLLYRVKSQKEKQISYIHAYIWDLENWNWLTYLQGHSREQTLWTQWGNEKVRQIETLALTHIFDYM